MKLTDNVLNIVRLLSLTLLLFGSFRAESQLSGTVFKDFNNNGIQNLPNEVGIQGITITAYIGNGSISVSKTSKIDGTYSFSAIELPEGSQVRLEFSNLGANNPSSGGTKASNIQFYVIPSGGVSNANLGMMANDDYCQPEVSVIFTPCYVNGDPIPGSSAGEDDALVMFSYSANGVAGVDGEMPTHLAKASEVGALWGMDYQARAKIGIAAAIVRRHVGLGPLGTGGIYTINFDTKSSSPLIDVKTLGIDTGPDPHTDLSPDKLISSQDPASMMAAGRTGIGGIALSRDEKTLYMVNLYDRKVYSFFVGVPVSVPNASTVRSFQIPNPCSDGDYRPWGIKEYNGMFYIGVVCSAETSQDSTKLTGTIYQLNPQNGQFKIFFQFPLTEKRGPADATADCKNIRYWRPWTDVFPKACATFFEPTIGKTVGFAVNPQPIITDLEFDVDGSMVIGLMDRMSLQGGFRALAPVDDGNVYDTFVSGDILRVYNNNGVYEMESNGKAGPLTGCGVGNDEGPGGGEFYCRDYWVFFGNPGHSEIANGAMILIPGTGEILTSAMDPIDSVFHAAGIKTFSNTDGSPRRSFAVYAGKKGTLGKSGGTGDIKANCGNSPIEIGNRVWEDLDKDGIQDPNEPGIDGLTVSLLDMDGGGIEIGSMVTSNGGHFIFNNNNTSVEIQYERNYRIRVSMVQGSIIAKNLTDISPGGLSPAPDEGENLPETIDSDAVQQGIYAVIDFQTGAYTQSNHNLDIGLTSCTIKCVPLVITKKAR